jgi:DNA-binding CsgD family transcriptional regulator
MTRLRAADLREALDVVYAMSGGTDDEPFPLETLEALKRLLNVDCAIYCENALESASGAYQLGTRGKPAWMHEPLSRYGRQDPIHEVHQSAATKPVAISDLITQARFHRLELYDSVCKPLAVEDSLRVYLPAPAGQYRFFFFDRDRRGFSQRERSLLELLRPHLAARRLRFRERVALKALTAREREVLEQLATGRSNSEIAKKLWIAEGTVRKHLNHVYEKLGVRTRTEAARILLARAADGELPEELRESRVPVEPPRA